jgi:hypothetical protein
MSYVLKIETQDAPLARRFDRIDGPEDRRKRRRSPTVFEIVFEDRALAVAAFEEAKRARKPGDSIELMSHELIGSV